MTETTYRFQLGADAEAMAVVREGLERFNVEQIGVYTYEDFQLYARDNEGQVVGGMFGHWGMGWLYVDYLWLDDSQRRHGLGRDLGLGSRTRPDRGSALRVGKEGGGR